MANFINAGFLKEGSNYSDIEVDEDTGTAVLHSVSMGDVVLSSLDIDNPVAIRLAGDVCDKMCAAYGEDIIGLIVSTQYVVALTETEARFVNSVTHQTLKTVTYDTDMEYDSYM